MPKQDKTRHYKPAAERKTVVIPLRVTADQRELFMRAAKRQKCRMSHWAREHLESQAKKELGG